MKGRAARSGGWFRPEATIDLHRFTVAEARQALETFLDRQFLAGKEWVLVVHGAKTLAGTVKAVVQGHPLVEASEPDNPGATRVRLGRAKRTW